MIADLNGTNYKTKTIPDIKIKTNEIQNFINSSGLECSIQELIGQYSIMENYFMTENIYKAIQVDTIPKNSITSSVVDDVFFIIKKCLKRCLCSDSVDGCCAMFNNCITVLESVYKDNFYSKLKLGYPSGFDFAQAYTALQRRFQNAEQMEKQKINFLITLNNIEWSIECITAMKKVFEDDVSKLFVQVNQTAKDKLNSCLNDLSAVSIRFKELLDYGFNQMNTNEIKLKIKQWCEPYLTINHKITEDELNQYSISDPFIQNFIKNIDQMFLSLKVFIYFSNN